MKVTVRMKYRLDLLLLIIAGIQASLLSIPASAFTNRLPDSLKVSTFNPKHSADSLEFSPEFLDTVTIRTQKSINDYSLLGVSYGVTFSNVYFSPKKTDKTFLFNPSYISITYTHFSKLFDMLPYCAIVVGASYGKEGYTFLKDDDGNWLDNVDGATECTISVLEMPAMAQLHFDFDPAKLMVNLGVYGGWRKSIERSGPNLEKEFQRSFRSYENRIDYGLQGGLGFGIILSPIEIHFNCLVRWSWSNLYQPNYENPTYHPQHNYYYRYAYPLDIIASVGIHFQLTKRMGKTNAQLKKEARKIVYGL